MFDLDRQYRLLFDKNPLPMCVFDMETLVFLAVNDAAVSHYGYSREEFLGMTVMDIRPPDDVPALLAYLSSTPSGLVEAGEWRHRKKDGTIIDVKITASRLHLDGRRVTVASMQDITERKRAEEAMRFSTQQFASAFEYAAIGMALVSPTGRWLKVNHSLCEITGYSAEELTQKTFQDITHPEDLDRDLAYVRQMLAGEIRSYQMEKRYFHKKGHSVWILLSVSLVRDAQGQPVHFISQIQDITGRKHLEDQLRQSQKMEAVGQLAGGIAHDFNNLLTGILGYSNMLLDRIGANDPMRADAEEIKKAGERAASLTRQLLAFGRRQFLQPKVMDLNLVVADLEGLLRRLIGEHIELITRPAPALGRVRADPGQVQQVIMNLVLNARDAMSRGGRLTIETANLRADQIGPSRQGTVQPGPYAMLAVTDTGCGMDADILGRVFEPFFTTKEQGKGTGLGLSTVYGIVIQSGGCLEVRSEPQRGTTFMVYLPCIEAEADEVRSGRTSTVAVSEGTVLLVEDEEIVRRLAASVLETNGYRVLAAGLGSDALRLAEQYDGVIHLLVTDIVMPHMSGPEVARRLSPLRPDMKVLFMSGYAGEDVLTHGLSLRGTVFLQKPFTPLELLSKVRELFLAPPGESRPA